MRGIVAGCAASSQFSRDAGAALTEELDLFTADMGQLDMVLLMTNCVPQGADITFQLSLIDGVGYSQQLENRLVRERHPVSVGALSQVHQQGVDVQVRVRGCVLCRARSLMA